MNETTLKQFYQIRTLDPQNYATDSFGSVDFEYDQDLNKQYDLLQKLINSNSIQSPVSREGSARKDDVEPLGFNDSMVEELLENDIIDDSRDPSKAKYFISDESFDQEAYLSLHAGKSKKELFSRLEDLDHEIAVRQEMVKGVLHDEFVRFITIKNSLDDTMERFGKEKSFKSFSNLGDNLKQASQESDNILTPAVTAKNKESMVRSAVEFVNEHKFIFSLPKNLQSDIKTKDYDSLIYDYNKGKHQYLTVLESAESKNVPESNVLLLNKVWAEVENTVNEYRKLIWDKLSNINIDNLNTSSYNISININNEHNYIALIYKLLELSVEDNPIIDFINIQYFKIEGEIEETFTSYIKNMSLMQNNILNTYSLESASPLSFLIRAIKEGNHLNNNDLITDLPLVADLWSLIQQFIANFTALVNKVVKFSSIVDFVANGYFYKQHVEYKAKKTGIESQLNNDTIERHLRFENFEVAKIKDQNEKLILKICDNLISFFTSTSDKFQTGNPLRNHLKEEIQNTPSEFGFLPPFTNAITASIQNLAIYNTISNHFQKLIDSKTMISRNQIVAEVLQQTCLKTNLALQTSVIYLLVNDMKFSYMLDLDDDTNLIELVELYFTYFIKKASALVHQQEITGEFRILPSKNLLASFESSFLKSLSFFVESNLKKNLINVDESAKYKTLMNFHRLRNELRPNILAKYDQYFKSNLAQQKLQVFQVLDNLELEIFESLTSPITSEITATFNSRVKLLSVTNVTGVSTVTKEIIAILVSSKIVALKLRLPDFPTSRILTKLIQHTFNKIQDYIKSSDTLKQVLVDLRYFELHFEDNIKRSESLVKSIDRLYGILSNKLNMRQIMPEIDEIVNRAIKISKIELE